MCKHNQGFTPLEKATDKVGGVYLEAEGGLMPPSAQTVRKQGSQTGFTIMEIIFALALLAVGLTEVVVIMGEGQFHNNLNRMNIIALSLAKERLEMTKNLTYANVATVPLTPYPLPPYLQYSYQVTVTPAGALPGQIKDVVVSVSYSAAKGTTNSINLETYIANY